MSDVIDSRTGEAPKPNPRHLSESVEHYTPREIVEAARQTLGGIDLDPASCPLANSYIRATDYFTRERDGFTAKWWGKVFLNPPGGRMAGNKSSQKEWWFKLASEWSAGHVRSAIFVCFSVELLQTSQVDTPRANMAEYPSPTLPLPLDFPICFPSRRIAYLKEQKYRQQQGPGQLVVGGSPPHASCIIWLPERRILPEDGTFKAFAAAFGPLGRVVYHVPPERR